MSRRYGKRNGVTLVMPFVKLDCGMLDSSIWFEREQREIFITALLMAEPYYCDVPQYQMFVDRIERTGFEAPAGAYGIVRAAGSGIVNRAGLDKEKGLVALAQLGNPDCESRSDAYEGRRMIRVNGGYLILNYFAYRDIDRTANERQQRYREKQKLALLARDSNAITPLHRDFVTQAEEEDRRREDKNRSSHLPSPEVTGVTPLLNDAKATPTPPERLSKGKAITVAEILKELEPLYPGVDMESEHRKMQAWKTIPRNSKRSINRQFIVNWLNKVEAPVADQATPAAPVANGATTTATWTPPTYETVRAFSDRKKWAAGFARQFYDSMVAHNWRHYGQPVTSDEHWQSLMRDADYKP